MVKVLKLEHQSWTKDGIAPAAVSPMLGLVRATRTLSTLVGFPFQNRRWRRVWGSETSSYFTFCCV